MRATTSSVRLQSGLPVTATTLVVTALECEHERAAASIADRPTVCQSRSNEGNNQLRSLAERTACHGNNQLRLQCGGWLTPASVAVNAADLQLPSSLSQGRGGAHD